jgi:N-acetyl-1-D-myo-inositol-2-amino-2-deoxy-alpha-D-glucopyranoside deacetylase
MSAQNQYHTLFMVGAHPDDETFGIGGTLAAYAMAGVKVYYLCGTRGEVGAADPDYMKGYSSVGDMRWGELTCAAGLLGLADIIHLGYRDSGMPGSSDNKHPQALAMAPTAEVAERIVKLIRELKPQVVITFDPIGGYNHPDHIAMHRAAVMAFHASGDGSQFLQSGAPYQPQKLYFSIFPRGALRILVKLMPLLRKDPHKFGRNRDIDLAASARVNFPVNAVIKLNKKAIETRDKARQCHASQLAGGGPPGGLFMRLINYFLGQRDLFMRSYPPPGKRKERDLFSQVK